MNQYAKAQHSHQDENQQVAPLFPHVAAGVFACPFWKFDSAPGFQLFEESRPPQTPNSTKRFVGGLKLSRAKVGGWALWAFQFCAKVDWFRS
jgi:hypothetical protein